MIELRRRYSAVSGGGDIEIPKLPEGYQRIEYTEQTDNTQWLVLPITKGFVGNIRARIYSDVNVAAGRGFRVALGWNDGAQIGLKYSNSKWYWQNYNVTSIEFVNGKIHDVRLNINNTDSILYLDEEELVRNTLFNNTSQMVVFSSTSAALVPFIGRFYELFIDGIMDGVEISMKLYPARKVVDGTIGMFDVPNGIFYSSAGTGNFTAGADID